MSIWEFIYTHAAPIGAFIVLFVTVLEFVFYNRTNKKWKRILILIQSTIVSLAFLTLIYFTWSPKDEWEKWGGLVLSDYNGCLLTAKSFEDNDNSKEFFCFANSLKANEFPNKNFRKGILKSDVPANYNDSVKRAVNARYAMEKLISNETFSNILTEAYGIYPNLFLGTGLTKPNGSRSGDRNGIREYLVTNFCAEESLCNKNFNSEKSSAPEQKRYPNIEKVWTWKFNKDHANDKDFSKTKVSDIIFNMSEPRMGKSFDQYEADIQAYYETGQTDSQTILVRFARFPPENYKGTVGHPDRKMVFFSDLKEVHDYSLSDSIQLSGIPETRTNDAVYFMWLVILEPNSLNYKTASWDKVIEDLIARSEG